MPADVFFKSIEFKGHSNAENSVINSVQCSLSDNTIYPLFEKEGVDHYIPKKFNFEPHKPVEKIETSQSQDGPHRITLFH